MKRLLYAIALLPMLVAPAYADQASYIQDMRNRGYTQRFTDQSLAQLGEFVCDRNASDSVNGIFSMLTSDRRLDRQISLTFAYDATQSANTLLCRANVYVS